jgi:hypothetical protein
VYVYIYNFRISYRKKLPQSKNSDYMTQIILNLDCGYWNSNNDKRSLTVLQLETDPIYFLCTRARVIGNCNNEYKNLLLYLARGCKI